MTIEEIKTKLSSQIFSPDPLIINELQRLKKIAVENQDESVANELWCYEQIYSIKKEYHEAFQKMKEAVCLSDLLDKDGVDSPKSKCYEEAWNALDRCDMIVSFLEENYCIADVKMAFFHINEIEDDCQKLFPLFPYKMFFSREQIIKKEKCSICGKITSVRNPCEHKIGKLYMGEMCHLKVVDFKFLGVSMVSNPFDRYAIAKLQGEKFDFSLLDYISPRIRPYSKWSYKIENKLLLQYNKTGRNDKCPCGSGKKFKFCIRDDENKHYKKHYVFQIGESL